MQNGSYAAPSGQRMSYNAPGPAPSSGSARTQHSEATMRRELGLPVSTPPIGAGGDGSDEPARTQDEMNNRELMQQAVVTHKDTTATTKRALQIVQQTQEINVSTQEALHGQREQMQRIEGDLDKIGEDLSYSERILRFMRMCCCFGFFCSCCTEPARRERDREWRGPGSSSAPQPAGRGPQQQPAKQRSAKRGRGAPPPAPPPAAYPTVSAQGLGELGFSQEAAAIDNETAQQNQYLDEIAKGLDQLKFGAQRMNDELRFQEAHADRIHRDADTLESKLHSVNREGFKRI